MFLSHSKLCCSDAGLLGWFLWIPVLHPFLPFPHLSHAQLLLLDYPCILPRKQPTPPFPFLPGHCLSSFGDSLEVFTIGGHSEEGLIIPLDSASSPLTEHCCGHIQIICAWALRFLILEEWGKTGEAVEDACLDGVWSVWRESEGAGLLETDQMDPQALQ